MSCYKIGELVRVLGNNNFGKVFEKISKEYKTQLMNIEGNVIKVKKSAKDLYEFLTKLENYEALMPESTEKFEVDGESFIFGLKGMPEIRLVMKEQTEFSNVTLGAASSKLPFTLSADIKEISDTETEAQLKFDSQFNAMMAMMAKSPITKFIDALTENLEKL